jgi:phage FluMu protein Com
MHTIRCPRCQYFDQVYDAPKGKEVRNPDAQQGLPPVYDDCKACCGTGDVPAVVLESIRQALPKSYQAIVEQPSLLRWSGDHFSFMCGKMYVGVEVDGYLHT